MQNARSEENKYKFGSRPVRPPRVAKRDTHQDGASEEVIPRSSEGD